MTFRFDHIAMYVSRLERSFQFYQSFFGLKEIPNPFPEGKRWLQLAPGLELHLISEGVVMVGPSRNHLCFSVSDFDGFQQRLEREGILYSDFSGNPNQVRVRPDGVRQIYFKDPDGYWIEVNDVGSAG